MTTELNFESLIAELGENVTKTTLGNMEFKELKMSDQRKIMNMSFTPIEIPARVANIFNEFIKNSISFVDDYVPNVLNYITVDIKPFLLTQIRILTLGDVYYDRKSKTAYTINPIKDEDVFSTVEPLSITYNNITIKLSVPTLTVDTQINNLLLNELSKFKKNLTEEDYGKVSDIYQTYEIFKYITEIEMGGKVFNFAEAPINKKMKIVNNLPPKVVSSINEYIESIKSKGEEGIIATNGETNETITLDVSTIFFENTARVSKNG